MEFRWLSNQWNGLKVLRKLFDLIWHWRKYKVTMTKANIEENGKGSWMSDNNVNSALSDNNYFHGNKILTEQSLNVADLLIMIMSAVLWCLDSAVLQYCTVQSDIVQTLQKCKQWEIDSLATWLACQIVRYWSGPYCLNITNKLVSQFLDQRSKYWSKLEIEENSLNKDRPWRLTYF